MRKLVVAVLLALVMVTSALPVVPGFVSPATAYSGGDGGGDNGGDGGGDGGGGGCFLRACLIVAPVVACEGGGGEGDGGD